MIETWKKIDQYENYKVSNLGRVKSLINNIILKPDIGNGGYYRVRLFNNGKSKRFSIHRLVATTFINNKHNKSVINHKDSNRINNTVKNLE